MSEGLDPDHIWQQGFRPPSGINEIQMFLNTDPRSVSIDVRDFNFNSFDPRGSIFVMLTKRSSYNHKSEVVINQNVASQTELENIRMLNKKDNLIFINSTYKNSLQRIKESAL
jgi:hypothetical protein